MGKPTVHVTPHSGGGRQAKISGSSRASHLANTQEEARQFGRQRAIDLKTELVIHGRDGKIRNKDSYGPDKCPPVG
ncbi:MAG: DUF2188 domain-containing protein [Candidatus Absconditabacterales bacterium]